MNMAIVHDIVLLFFYGCFLFVFAVVVAIPLNWVFPENWLLAGR